MLIFVRAFFEINGSPDILNLSDFTARKLSFTIKLVIKREWKKIKKIPHFFLETIIWQVAS